MAKRKTVEVLNFSNVQEAVSTKEKCEKRMMNYKTAKFVALASSAWGLLGGIGLLFNVPLLIVFIQFAVIGAIATYCLIGGFGIAVKAAGRIAVAGWYLIPIFPVDIFVLVFGFIFAMYAFLFLPILVLRSVKKAMIADLQAAEEYLAMHK